MNTIENTNSSQKVKEFVVAFTDGDCNHLVSEIVRRFSQRYELVLSCYYELIPDKHGNPYYETYWNHGMVRDVLTGDIIDIEGVHDMEYFTCGKWKMGEDIDMYVHTQLMKLLLYLMILILHLENRKGSTHRYPLMKRYHTCRINGG